MVKITEKTPKTKTEETVKFKGKYISAVGKRKASVARVRVYKKGKGVIIVNNQKATSYFANDKITVIKQPLKMTGTLKDYDFSIIVKGGGKQGQSEAIRHGITKALLEINEEYKPAFKAKGLTTRDARIKERKKPGLKKARKAPQWSKR
jgi:small subunit ribosomal protein S9